jgi:hypothetical protein
MSGSPHPHESHIVDLQLHALERYFTASAQLPGLAALLALKRLAAADGSSTAGTSPFGRDELDVELGLFANGTFPCDLERVGKKLGLHTGELADLDPHAVHGSGSVIPSSCFDLLDQRQDEGVFVHATLSDTALLAMPNK